MTIGEFSQATHLSIKTLRRYHEIGLLEPAEVDDWTGYRYYGLEQIATAQMIRRFRDLDMPLRDISELLGASDRSRRDDLVSQHLRRMEERLVETRGAVSALRRLLAGTGGVEVRREQRPGSVVAAVRGTVEIGDVPRWYGDAMEELDDALAGNGLVASGPPGALYDHELITEEGGELAIYLPVDAAPPTSGRVAPLSLPPVALALAIHRGSPADVDITYGRLGEWVAERGLAAAGPVHERYLVRSRDTPDSSQWRTELGWTVETPPTEPAEPTPNR